MPTVTTYLFLTTDMALVWFLVSMDHHVGLESLWLRECLPASFTLKFTLCVVNQQMALHVGLLVEAPPTMGAFPGLLPAVCVLMSFQVMFLKLHLRISFMHIIEHNSYNSYLKTGSSNVLSKDDYL